MEHDPESVDGFQWPVLLAGPTENAAEKIETHLVHSWCLWLLITVLYTCSSKGTVKPVGPHVRSVHVIFLLEAFHGESSSGFSCFRFAGTQFRDGVQAVVMIDGFQEVPVHIVDVQSSNQGFETPVQMDVFLVCYWIPVVGIEHVGG